MPARTEKLKRRLPSEQEYRRVHVTASEPVYRPAKPKSGKKEYLLVDGYNIIFAWEELKELSKINIDSARDRLKDIFVQLSGVSQVYADPGILMPTV